ncbi:MAG: hypothetical protein LBP92_12695 [Deltaproteobacteria bacterium]|jgi:hypothetical protein|nr:hypothetical protein [Deltaproteobacteria bacterium]
MRRIATLLSVALLAVLVSGCLAEKRNASPFDDILSMPDKPVLAEGEMYYFGSGKMAMCERVELGFVLSADKSVVRDFSVKLINLSVPPQGIYLPRQYNSEALETRFINYSAPVSDRRAIVSFGDNGSLTLNGLGEAKATGELEFKVLLDGGPVPGLGYANPLQERVDLGKAKLTLQGGFEVQ